MKTEIEGRPGQYGAGEVLRRIALRVEAERDPAKAAEEFGVWFDKVMELAVARLQKKVEGYQ